MFGKNLKKMFGTVLSAAMLVSALPAVMPVANADGEITYLSETRAMLYRDYEDYNGGNSFASANGIGTFSLGNSGQFANGAISTVGRDGKGVKFTTAGANYAIWHANLSATPPIKDGKLYMAFDVQRKSDADLFEMATASSKVDPNDQDAVNQSKYNNGHQVQMVFNGNSSYSVNGTNKNLQSMRTYNLVINATHSLCNDNNNKPGMYISGNGWQMWSKLSDMNENTTYKVEVVTDVTNRKTTYYVDGVKASEEYDFSQNNYTNPVDSNVPWGIYSIGLTFEVAEEYFDNLALVYYDDNTETSETFSVEGEMQFADGGKELKVKALSDVTDEKSNRAPYGVSIKSDSLKPENFVVTKDETPVQVTAVTRGEKSGEYILKTAEEVTAGDYTVTVNGVEDVTGCLTLNSTKNVATVNVTDKVFYVETFDDGNTLVSEGKTGYKTESGKYGTVDFNTTKEISGVGKVLIHSGELGATGSEYEGNPGLSMKESCGGSQVITMKFNENITSGVVSYSYETSALERTLKDALNVDTKHPGFYTSTSRKTNPHTMVNKTLDTAGMGGKNPGWYVLDTVSLASEQESTGKYKYDEDAVDNKGAEIILYTYDGRRRVSPQADGLGGWATDNGAGSVEIDSGKHTIQQIFDMSNKLCYTYVDGVSAGEPRKISSFASVGIGDIALGFSKYDTYVDNLRFQYMSETGDSFKMSTDSVLDNNATTVNVSFEDPVAKDQIITANFAVKKADGTRVNVTSAEWIDPYTAKLTVDAMSSGNYTVTSQVKTAVGGSADAQGAAFRVKTDGLYKKDFKEENGTYTVTLTNDVLTAQQAVLIAGVFVDGKMVECATSDKFVTADTTSLAGGAEDTLTVSLAKYQEAGAEVKVFLWNTLGDAKPLSERLK